MTQHSPQRKKASRDNIKNGVISGVVFGVFMGVFALLTSGPASALTIGVLSGIAFGVIITVFVSLMSRKMAGKLELLPGEEIVKEGPANHFYNRESVGGWLTVTNQRLCFTSHRANIQVHELSLPLHMIASAETTATGGIVPNGLLIKTSQGESERFVVNGRASWVQALGEVKGLRA